MNVLEASLSALRNLNETEEGIPSQEVVTEAVKVKAIEPGYYICYRHGTTKTIYVVETRKDKVYYKENPGDKHLQNITIAKFIKFYHPKR